MYFKSVTVIMLKLDPVLKKKKKNTHVVVVTTTVITDQKGHFVSEE